jgi:hypothetical protein
MTIYSKPNPPDGFYVYAYLREDGTPYYIGKGKAKRAWRKGSPTEERVNILESMLSEEDAFALEIKLITKYGRKDLQSGVLNNRTNGGEGCSGSIHTKTDEFRRRVSERFTGTKRPDISLIFKGKPRPNRTEQHRENISKSKRGIKITPQSVVCCPHCQLNGGASAMIRYHFDNCKNKN